MVTQNLLGEVECAQSTGLYHTTPHHEHSKTDNVPKTRTEAALPIHMLITSSETHLGTEANRPTLPSAQEGEADFTAQITPLQTSGFSVPKHLFT